MASSEASKEDRQLPASERRLRQAIDEGQVARSRDAAHVLVLGGGVGTLIVAGASLQADLVNLLREALRFNQAVRDDGVVLLDRFGAPVIDLLAPLGLVLGAAVIGAIAAAAIPGGLHLSSKALELKGERLNPIAGFKRIASVRNVVEFGKLALLATVLGAIGSWFALSTLPDFAALSLGSLSSSVVAATALVNGGFGLLILLLVALATFDVPFQWFRHRADLRMTREEVRQESKETEGDPHVRGQIRARQRENARRRMLAAVPAADVVVVNPTHYAVAIRYDDAAMAAPRVVAKGVDLLAARIQAIARESGVPVLEAPPLARALYANVEIDQEVPRVLYAAIAQVLAYVYQLKRWVPGRSAMPQAPMDIAVPEGMDPKAADATGGVA